MPHIPIKVGSATKIKGRLRDWVGGALVPVDLTGTTPVIKARIDKRVVKSWNGTPDPDQVNNRGVFTYQLIASPADIDKAGNIVLELHVTLAGQPHISDDVVLTAEKALA